MTKKVLSLLAVLVLVAPIAGLACDCCPKASTAPTTAGIHAEDCGCCLSMEINRDASNLARDLRPLSIFSKVFSFSPLQAGEALNAEFKKISPAGDLSPPFLFAKTPLHLSLQVLRL